MTAVACAPQARQLIATGLILAVVFLHSVHAHDLGREVRRSLLAPASAPKSAKAPSPSDGTSKSCCAQLTAINFQSNLPVVIVNTGGKNVSRSRTGQSSICTCSTGLEKGDVNMTAVFRVRGGTDSQLRNKIYQYAIDIDDKKWFLGMPKDKKWMLYGQDLDPLALHGYLGFELARLTGEYAIRTQYCELFINDGSGPLNSADHYRGIYLAMEKPKQGSDRIDIAKNDNPADITGGYIAEFKHAQNEKGLPTINGTTTDKQWNLAYPKQENLTSAQLNYIQDYLNKFETALYGANFKDATSGWRAFADESHWVNWFLGIELIRNVKHSYHSSSFIQKDAQKKFVMGPIWDNVQGFGTCCGYPVKGYNSSDGAANTPTNPASGGTGISSSGWLFLQCLNNYCPVLDGYAPGYGISTWFQQLWKDPVWVKSVANRYQALRAGNWSDASISGKIQNLDTVLGAAATRTYNRWPSEIYQPQYFASPNAQFTYSLQALQKWTLDRLKWLDSAVAQASDPSQAMAPYPSTYTGQGGAPSPVAAAAG